MGCEQGHGHGLKSTEEGPWAVNRVMVMAEKYRGRTMGCEQGHGYELKRTEVGPWTVNRVMVMG